MSKTVKNWLITAAVLVAAGLIVFVGVMVSYEWDFTKFSTVTYITNTYEVNGEFDKISINVDTTEIELVPTEDGSCRIVCLEEEKVKHSATVQNSTLVIDTVDTRKWYDYICISRGTSKMTVYLPQDEYASLLVDTDTGDVIIPSNFSFEDIKIIGDTADVVCMASASNIVEIESDTGNIKAEGICAEEMSFSTATGNINVNSITTNGKIKIETDTGAINLSDFTCANLIAESDTGSILLKNVVATGGFSIENSTGNVKFENSDASEISVKTSTGDVTGTLISEKVFITETSTGNIRVPKTITGGKCEITTSTGDIRIDIQ